MTTVAGFIDAGRVLHPGTMKRPTLRSRSSFACSTAACAVALLGGPLVAAPAHAALEPWYARATCHAALEKVLTGEPAAADLALRPLEQSRDADDVACSVYLRVVAADARLAVEGNTKAAERSRDRALKRLFGFAKAHAKHGPRFADLELDARMRRVRVLFERDEKTEAIAEARRTQRLLEGREGSTSPTVEFARGAMYGALGQASSVARMFLGLAGISGDPDAGYRALVRLADLPSVYRAEALQMARQFAYDLDDPGPLGDPIALGERLVERYPQHPQYAYDHAYTLIRTSRPERAEAVLAPHLERLARDDGAWAPTMRAKLHYLATRAALNQGELGAARAHLDAMAAQPANDFDGRVPSLRAAVERAEGANTLANADH